MKGDFKLLWIYEKRVKVSDEKKKKSILNTYTNLLYTYTIHFICN